MLIARTNTKIKINAPTLGPAKAPTPIAADPIPLLNVASPIADDPMAFARLRIPKDDEP